jgi:hypothetical protein
MPALASADKLCGSDGAVRPNSKEDFLTKHFRNDMHLAMHVTTIQFHQFVLSVVLVDTLANQTS